MKLSKKDAAIVTAALRDVNKLRSAVGLPALKKFPKAKNGFSCLELAFPKDNRDVGGSYVCFDAPPPAGFAGAIHVNVDATGAIAALDEIQWREEEAYVG